MKLKTVIGADRKQIFFIFAAFAVMVACSCFFAGRIVEKNIALNAERLLDAGESTARSRMSQIEAALLSLENGVQRRLGGRNARLQIMDYLLEVMNRL
ncbi:MAG: hypothetical protein LBO82_10235, partial [Synergistaceae bacterium]|nr:hypothetical protein [Synergistaceae bacterium]